MPKPSFDPRTALVVADLQNDFADPGGSLYIQGGHAILGAINELVERARAAGALVVYTQDWHPERTPHFRDFGGKWPVHCVRDTWGADFVPGLRVEGPTVRKGTGGEDGYSAFSVRDPVTGSAWQTELQRILQEHRIERVVVVGLAQDYCVKETALDARRLGYETEVVLEATRPVDRVTGEQALSELRAAGVNVT